MAYKYANRPLPIVPNPSVSGVPSSQGVVHGMPRRGRRPSVDVYSVGVQPDRHSGGSTGAPSPRNSGGATPKGGPNQRHSGENKPFVYKPFSPDPERETSPRNSQEARDKRENKVEFVYTPFISGAVPDSATNRPLPKAPLVDYDGPPLEPAPKPPGPPVVFKGRSGRRPSLPATPCQPMVKDDSQIIRDRIQSDRGALLPPPCQPSNGYIEPTSRQNKDVSLKTQVQPPRASNHITSQIPRYHNMSIEKQKEYHSMSSEKQKEYQNMSGEKQKAYQNVFNDAPPPPPAHARGRRPSCPNIGVRPRTPSPDYAPEALPSVPRDRRSSMDALGLDLTQALSKRGKNLKKCVGPPPSDQDGRPVKKSSNNNNNNKNNNNEYNSQLSNTIQLDGYIRMDGASVHQKKIITPQQKRITPPQMPAFEEEDSSYISPYAEQQKPVSPSGPPTGAPSDEADNYVTAYPTISPQPRTSTRSLQSRRESIMPPGLEDDTWTPSPDQGKGPRGFILPRPTTGLTVTVTGLPTVYGDPTEYDVEFERGHKFLPPAKWPDVIPWSALRKEYPSHSAHSNRFTVMQD